MRIFTVMAAIALAISANTGVADDSHGKEMGKGMQGMESMHGMDNMKGMEGMKGSPEAGQQLVGKGTVKAIDTEAQTITVAHEPIPALQWPAMTMKFELKDHSLAEQVKVNDEVKFEFVQTGGGYAITTIAPQE